jgi:hypothetical protein
MTACNQRPPEGHPFHGTGVACHLASGHVELGEAHSWDLDAAVARAAILHRAIGELRGMFPGREVEQFDVQPQHPIAVYEVDEHGNRADRPYRVWDQIAGPWLVVRFADPELEQRRASAPEHVDNAALPAGSPMFYYCHGCGHQLAELSEDWWWHPPPALCEWCKAHDGPEYAIWKHTGDVYRVGPDGAVDEDPILTLD